MFRKSPEQLTPEALQSAREAFIRAHEAVFERWFEKLEQSQRERLNEGRLQADESPARCGTISR